MDGFAAGNKGPPKAKPKAKVLAAPKVVTRSLPWDQVPEMTELLFYFIVLNGNHLSTSTKLWTKTQDQFFKQPLMLPYVELYKPKVCAGCSDLESVRKIKDRYTSTMKEILDDVENGRNQSGKYGERSKLHKAVENIVESKARAKQKKDDDDALKKELDLTESELLAGERDPDNPDNPTDDEMDEEGEEDGGGSEDDNGGRKRSREERKFGAEGKYKKPPIGTGKRKMLTGQLLGNPLKSQRVPQLTFEERLLSRLDAGRNPQKAEEEEAEKKMLCYAKAHSIGIAAAVARCYNELQHTTERSDLYECLDGIGMSTVISIYCSIGEHFGAAFVKTELKDLGVLVRDSHKIYTWLQQLRASACDESVSISSSGKAVTDAEVTGTNYGLPMEDFGGRASQDVSFASSSLSDDSRLVKSTQELEDAEEVGTYLFIYFSHTLSTQHHPLYTPAPTAGSVP
jgi:hypothetical protein